MCETIFGVTITNSAGRQVPTRFIGEQHVREDLGWIPSFADWIKEVPHKAWMTRGVQKLPSEVTANDRPHNAEDQQAGQAAVEPD